MTLVYGSTVIPRTNMLPVFQLPRLSNVDAKIAATNATINSINIQSAVGLHPYECPQEKKVINHFLYI